MTQPEAEVVHCPDPVSFAPGDERTLEFHWEYLNLPASVSIVTSEFWFVPQRAYHQVITKDNEVILSGNRTTQLRVLTTNARLGQRYRLFNKITTNETPAQKKVQSIEIVFQIR